MKPRSVASSLFAVALLTGGGHLARATPIVPEQAPPEHIARFALVFTPPAAAVDECGGAQAVKEAVERRLDRAVFTEEKGADASLIVSVELQPDARWHALIVERDRAGAEVGHRDLAIDAEECKKGIDTLAIVLAIMIGPPRRVVSPGAANEETPLPTALEAIAPPQAPAVDRGRRQPVKRTAPPGKPRWAVAPGAAMIAGSGILPGISWGVEGGVAIYPPPQWISFIARGQFWPSRSTGSVPEGHLDRISVALLACHEAARIDVASISVCAGLDGGRLHTSAPPRLDGPDEVSRLLLDVPLEARMGFRLASGRNYWLEPAIATQMAVLLRRDRFTYLNRENEVITLHRAAPISFQATIGVALHFVP